MSLSNRTKLRNRIIKVAPPTISSPATFTVEQGKPLAYALGAQGGALPLFWSISGANAALLVEDDIQVNWLNPGAVAPGNYSFTVTVTDSLFRTDTKTVTVTVVAGLSPLPGALESFSVDILNPTTARMNIGNSPGATSYEFQVSDSQIRSVPIDRRIRLLQPDTPYDVSAWGKNAQGAGPVSTVTVTTQAAGLPVPDTIVSTGFDEVDRSTYTLAMTGLPAGVAGLGLEIEIASYSGIGILHQHSNAAGFKPTLGGVELTLVDKTAAARHHTSKWTVPWGAGQPTSANLIVNLRDSGDVNPLTAQRCLARIRKLVDRPLTPLTVVRDETGPTSASVTIPVEGLATALHTAIDTTQDAADLVNHSADVVSFNTNLNAVHGSYASPDGETRTLGAAWIDTVSGNAPSDQRMIVAVYDKPTPQPGGTGVQAMWSDDIVEASGGVVAHMDWGRFDTANFNTWYWGAGNANPLLANLIDAIVDCGARYIRSGLYPVTASGGGAQMKRYMDALWAAGGLQLFGPAGNSSDSQATIRSVVQKNVDILNSGGNRRFWGVEGPNEENKGRPPGWNVSMQAFQRMLYQAVNGGGGQTAIDPQLQVLAPSIYGRNTNDYITLAGTAEGIADYCDWNVGHFYNGARKPSIAGAPLDNGDDETGGTTEVPIEDCFRDLEILAPGKPVFITETGFQLGNPQGIKGWTMPTTWLKNYGPNNISNLSYAKYLLRYFWEQFSRGRPWNFQRFGIYNFSDDVDTRPNLCFGLGYPNQAKNLWVARPAYYSYKRMNDLFKDKTWTGSAWSGARPSSLGFLDWKVTGANAETSPRFVGQAQPGHLSQKRDGRMFITLYQDTTSWKRSSPFPTPADPTSYSTANDLDPAARAVTLDFGKPVSNIKLYQPTFAAGGALGAGGLSIVQSWTGPRNTIPLTLDDHISVVEFVPS